MTLAQWQRRFPQSRVPFDQALAVLRRLVDAFHDAHVEGAEHTELAATSVLVEQEEDGSLSVRLEGTSEPAAPGDVSGARRYQAPERWWGARQSSYSDQYALAALFVELVTGDIPFADVFATGDAGVIRTAVDNKPPELPGDCPRRDALLRALSKDPRLRFRSCGEFLMALSHGHGAHAHAHRHAHRHAHADASRREGARAGRKPARRLFRRAVLLALVLGAGAVWAVRSGWYAQALRAAGVSVRPARAATADAAGKAGAAPEDPARKARLARLEREIAAQREAADKALAELQSFVEKSGGFLSEMRRDALLQDQKRLQAERTTLAGELDAAVRLQEALEQLQARAVPYEAVAASIPAGSDVAQAYAALGEAARHLKELAARFTEKHPDVVRQKDLVVEAGKRYFASIGASLRHVQGDLAAKRLRVADIKGRLDALNEQIAQLERETQVARLRQGELEQARARESQRLAELRQMETSLRFGTGAAEGSEKPESAP